jgi:hypothetical protein
VREGRAEFRRDVWRRLAARRDFAATGASRDLSDEREIEKVHADALRGGRVVARDLWAKLSWISRDPRDDSLRVRFSFGSELHSDWQRDARRAAFADALAEAAFPECGVLARNRPALTLLARATGGPVRLSERILFANAPGGGAAFHHDAETEQLGVAYAQLAGRTAWLALPKRELAAALCELAPRSLARPRGHAARALRALDGDHAAIDRILNRAAPDPGARRARPPHVLGRATCSFPPSPGPMTPPGTAFCARRAAEPRAAWDLPARA